ncbi:MAG: hypothetical protein AB8I69_10360 [Anaerolineae bacterium]|jgi:uncharacterized protein YpmS
MSSKAVVGFIVLTVVAQAFCCFTIFGPRPPYTVAPSDEALDRLQERIKEVEADDDGSFSVIVTEEEMTSLVVQALEEMDEPPPISQPQVLFRNNRVETYATIHATDSTDVPGMLAFTVDILDGEIVVTVEQIDLGPLPVPESLTESVTEALDKALADWVLVDKSDYVITDIRIGDKKAIIFGQVLGK